jgi:hypothetical protein
MYHNHISTSLVLNNGLFLDRFFFKAVDTLFVAAVKICPRVAVQSLALEHPAN